MKRIVIALLSVASCAVFVSAQTPSPCLDLSYALSRGMENANVFALQNFLYAQGYMTATPNGYFGPATFAGVKLLQKDAGFSQVGIVGPLTRAYIKSMTCQTQGISPNLNGSESQLATSTQQGTQAGVTNVLAPKPQLDSVDLVTVFSGGQTDWGFDLHGSNFGSTTNTVYYKNLGNNSVYTIGTFGSADGKTITLPSNIGSTRFACGNGCFQILPVGMYEISVQTPGGQSGGKYMEIKPFTITSTTGTSQSALPAQATDVRLGTLIFSTSIPVVVKSVSYAVRQSGISQDGVGVPTYTDVMRGSALAEDAELPPFQTMIVDALVSTSNTLPGTVTGFFTVTVEDYIGKKSTTFTSPDFLVTVQGTM